MHTRKTNCSVVAQKGCCQVFQLDCLQCGMYFKQHHSSENIINCGGAKTIHHFVRLDLSKEKQAEYKGFPHIKIFVYYLCYCLGINNKEFLLISRVFLLCLVDGVEEDRDFVWHVPEFSWKLSCSHNDQKIADLIKRSNLKEIKRWEESLRGREDIPHSIFSLFLHFSLFSLSTFINWNSYFIL